MLMSPRPISVLYFSNEFVRAGAEEHLLTLLRGLDRRYFRLLLVCPVPLAEKIQPDLPADVELFPLCLRRASHVAAAARLAWILRRRQVDILHSHLFYASLFASPLGWLCRVPVILETPHVSENWRRGWLKTSFRVDRLISKFVDRYIAVSEANARYLCEQKGLPAQKIVVIHNGSDLARFEPGRPPPAGLRRSLGFDEHDEVLVVVGRLEPQKGHAVLLKALSTVIREFPRVRLVCVGDGSLGDVLQGQARVLGLNGAVRFVGYQSKVADWLALADATVLPSLYEGLPLAAIESLAAGRPVIATAVDGTPEIVVDGKTGLLVPPGDPVPLAQAICRMLREPELRRSLGRAGRLCVQERFGQERQIERTQELYLAAFERRRAKAKGSVVQEGRKPERRGIHLVEPEKCTANFR